MTEATLFGDYETWLFAGQKCGDPKSTGIYSHCYRLEINEKIYSS